MAIETNASSIWWIGFILFVIFLIYIDLFLSNQSSSKSEYKPNHSPLRTYILWTLAYTGMAFVFCGLLWLWFGITPAEEFLAGYLIEKSLSVDNLFVMVLTFKIFHIRKKQRKELLVWGILGAIIMRAGFILAGSWILHQFTYAIYVFGAILVVASVKMAVSPEEDENEPPAVAKWLKKILPWDDGYNTLGEGDEAKFLVRGYDGKLKITSQLACLIVIEVGDIIFAVDSIPAIFAVTEDPFVVFTSNIFAILGLRSLFFVMSHILNRFEYLQVGLSAILGFVGMKMLLTDVVHIPTWLSLLVIISVLAVTFGASWFKKPEQDGPGASQPPYSQDYGDLKPYNSSYMNGNGAHGGFSSASSTYERFMDSSGKSNSILPV